MMFSREPDPRGVARLLRTLGVNIQIEGPDDDWSTATVVTGSLSNKQQLIFTHDKKYYSQPNWSVQLSGMRGYFSKFPDGPNKERVLDLIPTFGFALGTIHEPDFRDIDERLDIISKVAESLDAVLLRHRLCEMLVGASCSALRAKTIQSRFGRKVSTNDSVDRSARSSVDINLEFHTRARSANVRR